MLLGCVLQSAPSYAAESIYQPLLEADCPVVARGENGQTKLCHGPAATPFLVQEDDLRTSITFGGVGPASRPPFQSFASFNAPGEVIEWRAEGRRLVATILRWKLDEGGEGAPGEVLVVSRVGQGGTPGCVVAYVDALSNGDANELARDAADRIAPNIDCSGHVAFFYGIRGPSGGEPTSSTRD